MEVAMSMDVRVRFRLLFLAACLTSPGHLPAQTPGLVPLTEMGGADYKGYPGGLYPDGADAPPAAHLAWALRRGSEVVPRNELGAPDPNGWIAMVAVGMSNTTQEFAVFERLEDASAGRNPRVVIMNTAMGGQNATVIADPGAPYWTVLGQRLASMGMTAAQVQVVWLKEAEANPPDNFPLHAQGLRDNLGRIVRILHDRFPHLKICYLSSRIYGGYAPAGTLNPEPQAYESGFAVKWLIEDQIGGEPALDHGQGPGPVRAPLLLWGPYLWANGTQPRADGLTWLLPDMETDRVHPSASGELKVAQLLSAFFAQEPSAATWWPDPGGDLSLRVIDTTRDAHVRSDAPQGNFGTSARLTVQGTPLTQRAYLGFDLGDLPAPVALAKLSLRVGSGGGGAVSLVPDAAWTETGLTWSSAPAPGAAIATLPQSSRDGTIAARLTQQVNGAPGGSVSVALSSPAASEGSYVSREGGEPPRLVLVARRVCPGPDTDGDATPDSCDCGPDDPALAARPAEIEALRWNDALTLVWDTPVPFPGTATRYEVLSGDLASVGDMAPRPGDACIARDLAATSVIDAAPAGPPGTGRFLLVRAHNVCGSTRWETATDGADRSVSVCAGP
jgi:hypothetical protein